MTLFVDRETPQATSNFSSSTFSFWNSSLSFNTNNSKILQNMICKVLSPKITLSVLCVIEGGRKLLFVYHPLPPALSLTVLTILCTRSSLKACCPLTSPAGIWLECESGGYQSRPEIKTRGQEVKVRGNVKVMFSR